MSRQPRPLFDRLWEKIDKRGKDDCWLWTAGTDSQGYGDIRIDGRVHGKRISAHRAVYMFSHDLTIEQIPEVIRHKCDIPRCCNPRHLLPGTHQDNVRDRVERNRSAIAEQNGRSKLTVPQVREIKRRPGESITQLALEYGVSPRAIDLIRKGKNWKSVS